MTRQTAKARADAIATLHQYVKPGDTLRTVLRHVSASGMYRAIDVYVIGRDKDDCRPYRLSWSAARATDSRYDERHEAVGMSGAGMDMGFALVYSIGRTMWPDGYRCGGKRCHSNDHSNGRPRDGRSKHRDAGYALRQEWM